MTKPWEFLPAFSERFGELINEAEDTDTIDGANYKLCKARDYIAKIEDCVKKMKQVEHDLTQDVYNKFKDKVYVLIERVIGETQGAKGMEFTLMAIREENLKTDITKQAIKDEIEKQHGYFDGDDAIKLEEAVIKLTRGKHKRCIIDDDYLYYLKEVDLC